MRAFNLMMFPALAMASGCTGQTPTQVGQPVQTEASAAAPSATAAVATQAEEDVQPSPQITLQSPVQVD